MSTCVAAVPADDGESGDLGAAGFAVLRDLISPDEAGAIAAASESITTACGVEVCRRPNNTLVPMRWDAPALSALLARPDRMRRVLAASGGGDLRWLSAYLSTKEPRSGPLSWHQDWWCWDHPISYAVDPPQVALLCYLGPADRASGALRVLPGSHRDRAGLGELLRDPGAEPRPDDPVFRDRPGEVTVEVAAGDAVLVDYRLLHGTHPNRSALTRACLIANFAPNWRALPPEVRGHLIQGWALPDDTERTRVAPVVDPWLPSFDGPRRDLPLRWVPSTGRSPAAGEARRTAQT